jgi:hypothetical protein
VSLINYLPHEPANDRNKKQLFKILARLGAKPREYYFDSANPADFPDTAEEILSASKGANHIYLDVSVMSKLLILYSLSALWAKNDPFSLVYCEAKKYRPSLREYRRSLQKGHFGQDISMEFLFSGVFEPIIPQPFVGRAPLGRTRALVAFLGFNKRQAVGAAATIPYQLFVPIVGVPPNPRWRWRQEALIQINNYGLLASGQRISDIAKLKPNEKSKTAALKGEYLLHVSTLDYMATLQALIWVSEVHRYTHFLTIAPFGSKMQALGTFLFTRVRPESQIVYALPRDFHPRYSEGVKAIHVVEFSNPKELEKELVQVASPNLAYLENLACR